MHIGAKSVLGQECAVFVLPARLHRARVHRGRSRDADRLRPWRRRGQAPPSAISRDLQARRAGATSCGSVTARRSCAASPWATTRWSAPTPWSTRTSPPTRWSPACRCGCCGCARRHDTAVGVGPTAMSDQLALEVDARTAPCSSSSGAAARNAPCASARWPSPTRARSPRCCSTAPRSRPPTAPGGAPSRAVCASCRSSGWRGRWRQHGPWRGPALGQQRRGDAVLLGLGRFGRIAAAAHRAPGLAVELVLAAVGARRPTRRSGCRPTRTARCAAGWWRRRRSARQPSCRCRPPAPWARRSRRARPASAGPPRRRRSGHGRAGSA